MSRSLSFIRFFPSICASSTLIERFGSLVERSSMLFLRCRVPGARGDCMGRSCTEKSFRVLPLCSLVQATGHGIIALVSLSMYSGSISSHRISAFSLEISGCQQYVALLWSCFLGDISPFIHFISTSPITSAFFLTRRVLRERFVSVGSIGSLNTSSMSPSSSFSVISMIEMPVSFSPSSMAF